MLFCIRSPGTDWIDPLTDLANAMPVRTTALCQRVHDRVAWGVTPRTSAKFDSRADPSIPVYFQPEGHRPGAIAVPDVGAYLGDLCGRVGDVHRPHSTAFLGAPPGRRGGQPKHSDAPIEIAEHARVSETNQLPNRAIAGEHLS